MPAGNLLASDKEQNPHYITVKNSRDLQAYFRYAPDRPIVISGHRGGMLDGYPENCIESFEKTLSYMESFFPLVLLVPLPGVKLGLANIVTLYALYAIGFPSALAILLVRCTLGALFAGNASALLFSLLGGLSALLVMALLSGAKKLSIFGVSIAGAAAHNCGQVCAALITLGSTAPLYYLPFLLLVSLFTGALSGLITAFLFRAMAHTPYGTKGENQHG